MNKNTKKIVKIPKVIELVSALSTFLDSETEEGDEFGMTNLRRQVFLPNGKNPHFNTLTQKLTEGFLLKDILGDWEATINKENQMVERIKKIGTKKNNDIIELLLEIKKDMRELKKEDGIEEKNN